MEDNTQQQEEGKDKIAKKFNSDIAKITAIIRQEPSKNGRVKVPKDDVAGLVKELFAETNEETKKTVKEELKGLLVKYVEYNRAKVAKEKELEKLNQEQMKSFSEAAQKLFDKIEGIPALEKEYADALVATTKDQ